MQWWTICRARSIFLPMIGSDIDNPEVKIVRKADDAEPFSALGFKIMTDPFVGQLIFIRVYSGQLKDTGDSVLNPRTGKTERIGRLLKMHANKREEITEILAGDICAGCRIEEPDYRRHYLHRQGAGGA